MGQSLVIKGADFSSVKVGKTTIIDPEDQPSGQESTIELGYVTQYSGQSLNESGIPRDSSVNTYVVNLYDLGQVNGNITAAIVTCRGTSTINTPACVFLDANMQPIQLEFLSSGTATSHIQERVSVPNGTRYAYVTANTKYVSPALSVVTVS
jgi:hypothetical protein